MFLRSIETVFIMIILISIGVIMSYKGWISEETKRFMNKLIVKVSIPALTIYNFFETFDRDIITSSGKYMLVVFTSMIILYIFSTLLSKLLKIEERRSGSFIAMSTVSNSMFFGLPISLGLFGEASIPYVLFYYIANTVIFWGLCTPRIMRGSGDGEKRIDFKKIFNIPLTTVLICGILLYLGFQPPSIVIKVSKYMSSFVTPLASIVIGKIIYDIDFKKYKFSKSVLAVILMRFIVAPALIYSVATYFNLPKLAVQVFTIQAAMPVMMQTTIVSELYDADSEYVASTLYITIVLSLISIPIYMMLLG